MDRPTKDLPISRLAGLWLATLGAKSAKTRDGYGQDLRLLGGHLARLSDRPGAKADPPVDPLALLGVAD